MEPPCRHAASNLLLFYRYVCITSHRCAAYDIFKKSDSFSIICFIHLYSILIAKNANTPYTSIQKKPHRQKFRFYRPIHPIICVYINPMLWLSYWWDSCWWWLPAGCYLPDKTLQQGYIWAYQPYHENQDKGYAQFAHVAPVLAAQMTASYQGRRWRKSGPSCFLSRWVWKPFG